MAAGSCCREGKWRIRLSDPIPAISCSRTTLGSGRINSAKRYFLRCKIEVWSDEKAVFAHEYSALGQEVLIQFPVGTIGDTVGWFPYAVKFQALHNCNLTCAMAEWLIPLFADAYPHIKFVGHDGIQANKYYATYSMGLFFDDTTISTSPATSAWSVCIVRRAISGVDPTRCPRAW